MPQLSALIFDLDGTLVDSAADLRQALNRLLAAHNRAPVTLPQVKSMIGDGVQTLLRRAFAATGAPLPGNAEPTAVQDFIKFYQSQKASEDLLYPLARETISAFRAANIKIGLCTNKLYLPTLRLLDDIGIQDQFDFVAGCDTFPTYKPDPGHVLGVANALKVSPANSVMIGDSLNDIRAGQGAGLATIAVAHGYAADANTLGADAVISHFSELGRALRALGFDFVG